VVFRQCFSLVLIVSTKRNSQREIIFRDMLPEGFRVPGMEKNSALIARYSTLIAAPSICRNDILLFCAIGAIAAIAR
jgi:hypothetical protein